MPGTRVVLPAIRVTRGSTHQTYAKEKLKYIADVSYLIVIINIRYKCYCDTMFGFQYHLVTYHIIVFYSLLWKKLWTKRIRIWNRNDLRGNNSQDCKHLVLSYQQSQIWSIFGIVLPIIYYKPFIHYILFCMREICDLMNIIYPVILSYIKR